MSNSTTQAQVRDYYGTQLQTSQDLKTNACCTTDIPAAHRRILATLESEVLDVHSVQFGGGPDTKAEFFCRQTYMDKDRSWVSLKKSHLTCGHAQPPVPDFGPGDTLLVHVDPASKLSEPCEFISSFTRGNTRRYQMRRLLRRRDVDLDAVAAKPNELVYTQVIIDVSKFVKGKQTRECTLNTSANKVGSQL